ncbi:MAG: hypothetical protein CPSOU_3572 [uncultured Paraburkholderia sp.]|nr:MAG: hypothetical protein CPSOU_3572 [uncultured Paraburkholderia sp.]
MVKKTIPNQGRQPEETSNEHKSGKLRQAFMCRETWLLLLSFLRVAVSIVRLFDKWQG